ncbi:MAG: hypothetical protein NZM06_03115 [Chloroherpetonaceae bacterium]|nr:hypothetical protein [Chloroherpetonaceae bacterium]MDW8436968.1 hypothetical protein [Chloroherpetonaceae bacterium]
MNDAQSERPSYWRSVMYGALINNVVSVLPFVNLVNALGGVGLMLAGGVAAYHYVRAHEIYPTLGACFQVGALAGLLGCLIWLLRFVLFGGYAIEPLQIAFAAVVVGGVSGVISGSVIRRKYVSRKSEP